MSYRFAKTGIILSLFLIFAFGFDFTEAKAQTIQTGPQPQDKKPEKKQKQDPKNPVFTAEQIADGVIIATAGFGGRETLKQVRGKGIERGKYRRTGANGQMEEYTYERRFVRGEDMNKDKVRLDQKSPRLEYALVFSEGNIWGVANNTIFTPRSDIMRVFNHQLWYSLESLLRYKENGSTLNLNGKEKQGGVEVYVLEVTDKENHKTKFYISTRLLRVLWLEYESPFNEGGTPVKYMKRFYDYRVAQGTLLPYKTVFYENGQQIEESNISTITFGLKVEEILFDNPNLPKKTT